MLFPHALLGLGLTAGTFSMWDALPTPGTSPSGVRRVREHLGPDGDTRGGTLELAKDAGRIVEAAHGGRARKLPPQRRHLRTHGGNLPFEVHSHGPEQVRVVGRVRLQ